MTPCNSPLNLVLYDGISLALCGGSFSPMVSSPVALHHGPSLAPPHGPSLANPWSIPGPPLWSLPGPFSVLALPCGPSPLWLWPCFMDPAGPGPYLLFYPSFSYLLLALICCSITCVYLLLV